MICALLAVAVQRTDLPTSRLISGDDMLVVEPVVFRLGGVQPLTL
jgi:hypothetical protein